MNEASYQELNNNRNEGSVLETVDSGEDEVRFFQPQIMRESMDLEDDIISISDPVELEGVALTKLKTNDSVIDLLNGGENLLEDLPQGRNYGIYSSLIFILSRIIGSGIFSTPGGIYRDVGGSPFLFFLAWFIATVISFLNMVSYLELGTMMPRSGGPKVFVERIYRKPKYLATTLVALHAVMFGFTCSAAIIFGQYMLRALDVNVDLASSNLSRYIGFILVIFCVIIQSISVKFSVFMQNALGFSKMILLGILALTCIYVFIIPSSLTHLENHLHWDTFFTPAREVNISSFTSAVLQAIFSYNGWEAIYFITSEVDNPIKTLKIVGPLSLGISSFTYMCINIAYLKIVSQEDIFNSGQLIGSLLFEKVFGKHLGKQFLNVTVALSAAGNVYVVMYAISRMSQEVFREGILPFSRIMASNVKKLGTPVPTLILCAAVTGIILIFPPPGDVYTYIVSLETYSLQLLMLACMIGVFKLRKDFPDALRPIKVTLIAPFVSILFTSYLIFTPLIQDNKNIAISGLPNYGIFALLIVFCYSIYWFLKFIAFPKLFHYKLQRELDVLSDGLEIKSWTKIYN